MRRTLRPWGRLHIDRQLPFICLYRRPAGRPDVGTDRFIVGEASYLKATGDPSALVARLVETLEPEFGAFLLVEIWTSSAAAEEVSPGSPVHPRPAFGIVTHRGDTNSAAVQSLKASLEKIRIMGRPARVRVSAAREVCPPDLPPVLSKKEAKRRNCTVIGIEIRPVFRDQTGTTQYTQIRRSLHRGISTALKRAYFRFVEVETTHRPPHYHALGRRAVVQAVWTVDRQLSEIINAFDLLLLATPVNTESAWKNFQRGGFEKTPRFLYRPVPGSPSDLKRGLYRIKIDRVEDPTLSDLFDKKQRELDRKITMLQDLHTPRFLYGSLQLYGKAAPGLLELARSILGRLPTKSVDSGNSEGGGEDLIDAAGFAERARAEIESYREKCPGFHPPVRITRSVPGLIVSRGRLLVGRSTQVAPERVEAALHHEVGTHLVTHYNGGTQPFRLLRSGLPGYEETQEGLAVLSEYLIGGLDRGRLRILAARVLAAHSITDGASFVETFRMLRDQHGFAARAAFRISMRIYRGGGLIKDLIYLRGFQRMVEYVAKGRDLEILFHGKINEKQIPIIDELLWRKVLKSGPLRPRVLDDPRAVERLDRLRRGLTIEEILAEGS